jgi:hypothetical protein
MKPDSGKVVAKNILFIINKVDHTGGENALRR